MPKHGLAPTREKPGADPSIGGTSPSIPTPVVLSNEVLLRSKIAQLQLEKKAKQQQPQRKTKSKNQRGVASTSSSSDPAGRQAAEAAGAGVSFSSSPAANAARGSRGGGSRPARKAPSITSKHQLATTEAVSGGPREGRAAAGREKDAATAVVGGGVGVGGAGAQAGGVAAGQPETEEEVMRRFEAQVALAHKKENLENSVPKESSSKDCGHHQKQQQQWLGFTPQGIQALRVMYREQVHAARSMNKHADVLTRKTQEIDKSNEVMRAEAEACTHEAVRLEQAAVKLHALSVELDGRRTAMLETRKVDAAEETARREDMNASLNAVVGDISKRIKEQEEQRLAQDAENSSLRSDLQALLQSYDDNKSSSEKALRAHEEEGVKLAERLEVLIAAATEALEREKGLRTSIGELTAGEEKLRQRVGEHATRLQRQEAGLKTYLESVQRLQAEETKLLVSVARFSKEKTALLARAGCLVVDGGVDSGGGVVLGGGGAGGGGERGGGIEELGENGMRALLCQKEQSAAEMGSEKDRLQARCRELQAERTRITAEANSLADTAAAAEKEEAESSAANDEVDVS